jgi:hypothetical protein
VTARRRLFSVKQRPATFAEAGVAAPFTTPAIAQARLRLDQRGRIEVVARNPTGSDGMYVVPLAALGEFFRLSIHDRAMVEKIEATQAMSPITIRRVALQLAMEGLAGPDAKAAAVAALRQEEEHALLTLLLLLEQLLAEAGLPQIDWKQIDTGDKASRERLKPYFKSLEPALGMSATALIAAVDALSALVAPIGVARAPFQSIAAATLGDVQAMRQSIEDWAKTERDDQEAIARLVVECAALTIACAEKSMAKATALVQSVRAMVEAHASAPDGVADVLTRPIWLLDGWRHLTALWAAVAEQPREAQRDAMIELGELVPLVPMSADEWLGGNGNKGRSQFEIRRQVRLNEDWRSGLMIDRQALIEQLQAASL